MKPRPRLARHCTLPRPPAACFTQEYRAWCCDEQVGICYAFAGKHCPSPIFDAGFD